MNREFTFANHYKAVLTNNQSGEHNAVQLYSPDGQFLASVLCENDADFHAQASGLLHGYFFGWNDCKRLMQRSISEACRIDMIK